MALNIPKVVQSLFVSNEDASRVRDNIITALQPVLDFVGQFFTPGADGSLIVQRPISAPLGVTMGVLVATQGTINGPLTATMATINGPIFVNGTAYFKAPGINGVVIQPGAVGPAFYVTNVGGTAANFAVYDNGNVVASGSVTAPTFTSGSGFKSTVDMGHYYHTAYPGGQRNTVQAIINQANGGANFKTARYVAPRSGSVTAISVDLEFAVNTRTDAGVLINGTLATYQPIMAANLTKGTFNFNKGSVGFSAGDVLTCYIGWGAVNINTCSHLNLEIELGA